MNYTKEIFKNLLHDSDMEEMETEKIKRCETENMELLNGVKSLLGDGNGHFIENYLQFMLASLS